MTVFKALYERLIREGVAVPGKNLFQPARAPSREELLAAHCETYVDAVSRLVRAFPKRARGFRRGADAPAERVERREGEGAPADAEDEETARKKKKRRHVPRWVADGVADARAARA